MDFGDIITLLIYIAIPVLITNKRRARKAQQASQQRRQPVQRQPVPDKAQGGLMGRLESMIKELEKAAEEGKPAGMHSTSKPAPDVSGASGYTGEPKPGRIPVWRVVSAVNGKEAKEQRQREKSPAGEAATAAAGQGGVLFDRDDLVKGIILSEILQPPVAIRRRSKRRSF